MPIQSYKELIVWQKAMDLAFEIYQISKSFPKDEIYSLTNQLRRAVISVPSNIAEGSRRTTRADYLHFLTIAHGSLAETETQMLLAIRLGYISEEEIRTTIHLQEEVSKMLYSLRLKLDQSR